MYAPVAVRFFIYDIPLDGAERDYMHSVIMHPAVQHWLEAATLEHPGGEASLERTQEVAVAASADAAPATSIAADRKSVVSGKSVSVRVDLGGRRIIQKKKNK